MNDVADRTAARRVLVELGERAEIARAAAVVLGPRRDGGGAWGVPAESDPADVGERKGNRDER